MPLVVSEGAGQFRLDLRRDDGRSDQLAVRVFERGAGGRPRVLEQLSVRDPQIGLELKQAIAVSQEDQFHLGQFQLAKADDVVGGLDNYLMGPKAGADFV